MSEMPEALITPPPLQLAYNSPDAAPAHWTNVTRHRPDRRQFWTHILETLLLTTLLRLPRVLIFIALLWYLDPFRLTPELKGFFYVFIAGAMVLGWVIGYAARFRRERKFFADAQILCADQGVLRLGGGMPAMEIARTEIVRIETRPRGQMLQSTPKLRQMMIPIYMEGYDAIVTRLAAWTEIPHSIQTLWRRVLIYGALACLACLSAAATMMVAIAPSTPWSWAALIYLIGISTGVAILLLRSPNLTPLRKTMMMVGIVIGIAYIVGVFALRHISHLF